MADVKDILGVPRGVAANAQQDAPKTKERMQRPAGMSREAFALLDGSHPIPPSHLAVDLNKKAALAGLKQKRKFSSKGLLTYQFRPFTNPARKDGLVLQHWVKCFKDTAGKLREADETYPFAKFNKQLYIFKYDDDEWDNVLVKDPAWTREETDYLLQLCELFDLRFLIIADRYEYPGGVHRSMEDIKARYYAVARQLLVGREGTEDSVANNVLVRHPFNLTHERERKRGLELAVSRTPQQEAEENAILEQAAIIQAARKAEQAQLQAQRKAAAPPPAVAPAATPAAARPQVAATPSGPLAEAAAAPAAIADQAPSGQSSLFSAEVAPAQLKPGVYARGRHTQEVATAQLAKVTGGTRAQKLVDTTMLELGVPGPPSVPTRATCGAYLALRAEVIAMLELRKTLQHRQAGEGGPGSDNRGRRAAKGKAPARYDTEDTPAAKRPRVSKKFSDD
ncbi:hypothetical protein ABBQ38_000343 [Trebouxia sp. C0009 RCD-2024]